MATGRAQISKMVELGGAVANNTNKKKKYDPLSLISSLQKNVKPSYNNKKVLSESISEIRKNLQRRAKLA